MVSQYMATGVGLTLSYKKLQYSVSKTASCTKPIGSIEKFDERLAVECRARQTRTQLCQFHSNEFYDLITCILCSTAASQVLDLDCTTAVDAGTLVVYTQEAPVVDFHYS